MLSLAWLTVAALLVANVAAQCRTNENPYCAGNDDFEAICCTYPNICYWQRGGSAACCAAGQWCLNSNGYQVTPQAQYTTTIVPAPAPQPTTIYTTVVPQTTPIRTITQQPQPTQQTVTATQQPPQQSTVVVTTEDQPGPVEGIGSTVIATASSVINVFEGAAATARPAAHHAVPVAGAMAVAAWHMI